MVEIAGQEYADRASYNKRIESLQRLSGEQRLALAIKLWQTTCEITRAGIRAQHAELGLEQVERELVRRIMAVNGAAAIIHVRNWD